MTAYLIALEVGLAQDRTSAPDILSTSNMCILGPGKMKAWCHIVSLISMESIEKGWKVVMFFPLP